MDKPALFETFRAHLEGLLDELERSAGTARSGTRIDADRPTNRGERAAVTSQGYLALGIGQRMQALTESLRWLKQVDPGPRDTVVSGALATVESDDGQQARYLVLPGGQGTRLESPDGPVVVLSPDSPLAASLRGLGEGDIAVIRRGDHSDTVTIVAVS